jgi:uncharacterized Ntn-hydrolase superfamily protein
MTYSIVARDPVTGDLGVAVQSGTFGVGTVVPWARPGVGAVATQAIAEPAYGPRCLDTLAAGSSATAALEAAATADAASFLRQVGVVAADGTVAAVTGEGCIDHAGHLLGDGFTVQANMMASPRVWPAMADAFTAAVGPLPGRLLAALEAAQRAGGDARGMMSAALLVVGGQPADPWAGRLVDLRVDRAADPVADLRGLLDASDAYALLAQAVGELFGGGADAALSHVMAGLGMLPGEENLRFLRAGALLARGDLAGGRNELRSLLATRPSWEVIIRSFAAKGLLAVPPDISVDTLLAETR